jgi:ubiquinol-cytochrome c reductase cytochrome c1 subunit
MQVHSMRTGLIGSGMLLAAAMVLAGSALAEEAGAARHEAESGVNWQEWKAGNDVKSTASLQRGAANFVNYCSGCHSLKYVRWSRLGQDLNISDAVLTEKLLPADAKLTDYIVSSFPKADAENWFGRQPPDLSLVVPLRGANWVYRFLKGFYVDKSKPTGTNNLVLEGAAMPAVLSDLEGVKAAVFAEHAGEAAEGKVVERFETVTAGRMTPAEFDGFVRDTVNFLDYASDPSQVQRRAIGIWVILFLLTFTAFAWMLKKEYWKDVH